MNNDQLVQLRLTVSSWLAKDKTVEEIEKLVQYIVNGTDKPKIVPVSAIIKGQHGYQI